MSGIATITCRGAVLDNYAPFVCGPFAELGAGRPLHAPTLVRVSPEHWQLQVVLRQATPDLDEAAWLTGLRSLDPDAFKTGAGFRAAPDGLHWEYSFAPFPEPRATELFYYSGWPLVYVEIQGADMQEVPMRAVGPGRSPGETLWTARLPAGRPFLLGGPASQVDRPSHGAYYRPLGSTVYLVDGEFFSNPPPARRSAPRIETLRFPAPEMHHVFIIHVALPRDYDVSPNTSYPLVFLNDGQNQLTNHGIHGGWHSDTTATRLMREGRMHDAVLVAVEIHPDRARTFLHQGDQHVPYGQAQIYTDLLAGPVLDMLRQRYRIRRGAEHTALVGSSYGAAHALFAGLTRPDAFGMIGSLSFVAQNPEREFSRIETLAEVPMRRFYLDSGTRWGEQDDESTSDDETMTSYHLRDLLLERGMVLEQSLHYYLAYGDAHNELAWRRRIAGCFEFLLPPP